MSNPKAEAKRKKAAIKAAVALQKASDAVNEFAIACVDCNDNSHIRAANDGRILLIESMMEYSGWLSGAYDK